MSNRERRRAERRKRKHRRAAREEVPAADESAPVESSNGGAPVEDLAAEAERRGVSRAELKDERARAKLEPLATGERPLAVTLGAIVSALIALITVVAYLAGAEVDGERPSALQVFAPAILFAVMAAGMWRARYWAVLGFQAIMAIVMVFTFIALISAVAVADALVAVAVLAVAGAFFWFLVKALARIQMPRPPGG